MYNLFCNFLLDFVYEKTLFITGIYNVKRMRHNSKEKQSFKINEKNSKDIY